MIMGIKFYCCGRLWNELPAGVTLNLKLGEQLQARLSKEEG
jgi:hypothetical protein